MRSRRRYATFRRSGYIRALRVKVLFTSIGVRGFVYHTIEEPVGRNGKGDDVNSVMREVYRRTDGIKTATIRVYTQPMISGYGMSNGFEPYVQDKKGGSVEDLPKYVIILF